MESYYYFDKSDYQIDLSNLPKIKKNGFNYTSGDLILNFVTDDKELIRIEKTKH
jgi:hypothetical protein